MMFKKRLKVYISKTHDDGYPIVEIRYCNSMLAITIQKTATTYERCMALLDEEKNTSAVVPIECINLVEVK